MNNKSLRFTVPIALLFAVILAIIPATSPAAPGPGTSNNFDGRRVLLIGIDGVQREALQALIAQNRAPHLKQIADTGVAYWNLEAGGIPQTLTEQSTLTGPGWATILTGVFSNKHGFADNQTDWYIDGRFRQYPHFYKHIRSLHPDAWLASISHAVTPNNVLERSENGIANLVYTPTSAEKNSGQGDVKVTERTISTLQNQNPDALFIHFLTLDTIGHTYGYGKNIPQYMNTLQTIDGHIGDILAALQNRPQYAAEKWLICVTTDHGGGLNKAHGSQSDDDRHIFGFFNGPGFTGGRVINTKTYQTLFAPTLLRFLGININPEWGMEDEPSPDATQYPPAIDSISISEIRRNIRNPKPDEPVTISARVTGATSVNLIIALNNGPFTATPMTPTTNNHWQATIPAQPDGTRVRYYPQATNAHHITTLPFPLAQQDYYSYTVEQNRTNTTDLVINEIMYNPTGADNSSRSEWIEIYNRRNTPINVSHYAVGDTIANADDFLIPENTIIPAKGYLILAGNYDRFINEYPHLLNDPTVVIIDTHIAFALNNDGDTPAITHANDYQWNFLRSEPFQHVPYSSTAPWPPTGSGGPSIELNHPTLNVTQPENWSLTTITGGTPGRPNSILTASGIAITSVTRNIEYPTPADPVIITAQVKADSNIYGYLYATIGNTNQTILMADMGNNTLQANLGTIPDNTLVSYHIQATAGAKITRWPIDAPASRETFRVDNHPALPGDLVINEINYDPQGTDNGTNSEWFEIYNNTPRPIDISHFTYSVRKDHNPATFPPNTVIPPHGYLIVAGVKTLFETRHPQFPADALLIDANWPAGTSVMTNSNNSNLLVRIQHINATPTTIWTPPPAIDEVPYRRDRFPWPGSINPLPNNNGHTIELLHPSRDNTQGQNWRVSQHLQGTPGQKNSVNTTPSSIQNWTLY